MRVHAHRWPVTCVRPLCIKTPIYFNVPSINISINLGEAVTCDDILARVTCHLSHRWDANLNISINLGEAVMCYDILARVTGPLMVLDVQMRRVPRHKVGLVPPLGQILKVSIV